MESTVDALVQQVLAGAKYRFIAPELVRRIGNQELQKRRTFKEAIKATRNKLHQVGGAYHQSRLDYAAALTRLRETAESPEAFRATCRTLMRAHTSTNERLPVLDHFYATILANLPPIHSILDVACGLNPLAWPWLSLPPGVAYTAVDIYADMLEFIQGFFEIAGVNGRTRQLDILGQPPVESVDLILLLKTLPCLEQVDKTAAAGLLDALNGRYLLISYPAQSLGGRSKGMVENYARHFAALANGRDWHVERFEFSTELAFLVKTNS